MLAGLITAYDSLEIFASASANYSLSDPGNGVIFNAGLTTYWCPTPERDPFVAIAWSGTVAPGTGAVTGAATVSIPPLGIGPILVTATALVAAGSVSVRLTNFRLYQRSAGWYATWTALTITIGTTAHPFLAGSIAGPRLAPTGIPFLGIPPTLETRISPSAVQLSGPIAGGTSTFSRSYSANSACAGGYRVKEPSAGSFTAFPVDLNILLGDTTGCACEPSLLPAPAAQDTASGIATSGFSQTQECVYRGRFACTVCPDGSAALIPSQWDVWDTTAQQDTCASSVTLVPSLPKSVKRFGPDYAALIYRGGLPQTTAAYSDVCHDFVTDIDTGNVQVKTNPHPRESSFLGTVTNAPHIIEAPFAYRTIAPYGWGADKLYAKATAAVLFQAGSCPPSGEGGGGSPGPCFPVFDVACEGNRLSNFPAAVDDDIANPQLTPGLYHPDPIARYVDYWSAPHWNYAYWFPPNVDSGPLKPYEWPLDNARANPSDYWLPARTQWVWNPLLPASEATRKRADLISSPLAEGGLAGFWGGFY
jgi:hypothetical protein